MCAISGILNHHNSGEAKLLIRAMSDVQAHRGPDEEGFFCDDAVAFGHRRLAVVDLETGQQPITRNGITAVLDGKIYNFRDLKRELETLGHTFSTDSDTEVLIHLYERMGSEFLPLISGMFAFAIYDRNRKRVLLARDRMGKKPLVYFLHRDALVFASTLNGLKQHPDMNRELDYNAISDYLSLQYIPEPATIYRKVKKVPAGCLLDFQLDGSVVSLRPYWHLSFAFKPQDLPFEEAAAELRSRVEKSVEKRLESDVPLGVFLSGGIDSTIISAVAAKKMGKCKAFTVGFENIRYDERRYAACAVAHINKFPGVELEHHVQLISPGNFDLLKKLISQLGQPFADASVLPTSLLSEFARKEIKVALGGDGADELFCGYERYSAMRILRNANRMPQTIRKRLFGALYPLLPDSGERSFTGRMRRLLRLLAGNHATAYFDLLDRCPGALKKKLFAERLFNTAQRESFEVFLHYEPYLTAVDREERCSELDLYTYLPGDILTKADTASMAFGLEVRSPFFDHNVVEFAAALPMQYKMLGMNRKRILKAAFHDLVPLELQERPKKGFGVPIAQWLRNEWKVQAQEVLFSGPLCQNGFIHKTELQKIWHAHCNGKRDWSYLLWSLLILALFLDEESK